jgi:hypothetical protein
VSGTKETKASRKGIVITFGIVCVILVACIGGLVVEYMLLQEQIASSNSTINSLASQITNLQRQVNGLLNGTASFVSVGEIASNLSEWVNRTVVVEGNISHAFLPPSIEPPWNYELRSNGATVEVLWLGDYNLIYGKNVTVLGVVVEGRWTTFLNGTAKPTGPVVYFIEAESIELL